jgi:Fur family transcriptional regulator, ferric uptake regulator
MSRSSPTAEDALRSAGLRVTRQRLAVLDALDGREGVVTAQDLHHELRARAGSPGLATIYRTLSALAEAGELDVFPSPKDGEQSFRRCRRDHHHHLLCESCGEVQEVGAAEIERWISRVSKRRGFEARRHTVDVFGLCRKCH